MGKCVNFFQEGVVGVKVVTLCSSSSWSFQAYFCEHQNCSLNAKKSFFYMVFLGGRDVAHLGKSPPFLKALLQLRW